MTEIPTQPSPKHITRAADLLEAMLLGGLTIDAKLAVGAALATLIDVHPPYPPPAPVEQPMSLDDGLPLLLEELRAAAEGAKSIEEAVRVSLAACELRPLR